MRTLTLVGVAAMAPLLVPLLAGCGDMKEAAHVTIPKVTVPKVTARSCSLAAPGFRTCITFGRRHPDPTIERRVASAWTVVAGPLKPSFMDTQWGPKVWLSPDRRTLLAEWEYACDGHLAVFVPADGGKARVVTGERDWRKAVASMPLGWTGDGLARVQLLHRSGARPAGVYLFDPAKGPPKATRRATGC